MKKNRKVQTDSGTEERIKQESIRQQKIADTGTNATTMPVRSEIVIPATSASRGIRSGRSLYIRMTV
ncbi:MAG: hypothetical protein WCP33_02020 [Deltaproteobacteria bacterium]